MPGVMIRFLPAASAAFRSAAVAPGLAMKKSEIGSEVPAGLWPNQLVACVLVRTAGTNTCQAPWRSTYRNGFSLTTGVCGIEMYGGVGKEVCGALATPTNTKFQFEPTQLPTTELRVIHCCWVPEWTAPVIWQSAMNPPLDHEPSSSLRSPSR